MEKKICTKCSIEKSYFDFHKHTKNKDGLRNTCKECRKNEKKSNREYYQKNKENIISKHKKWLEKNPNYQKEYGKKYNLENRAKLSLKQRNYRKKNNEELNKKNRIKRKIIYEQNILYKLKHLYRARINKIIKHKRNKSSIEILGCSIEEFKKYIESKFTENMSWENYGYYGWHIDHIIPISSAKTEEEIYKLSHYTNLQPLWGLDNIKKSNKIL